LEATADCELVTICPAVVPRAAFDSEAVAGQRARGTSFQSSSLIDVVMSKFIISPRNLIDVLTAGAAAILVGLAAPPARLSNGSGGRSCANLDRAHEEAQGLIAESYWPETEIARAI
jgi:hypothetical protein